jgi:plastocyanin
MVAEPAAGADRTPSRAVATIGSMTFRRLPTIALAALALSLGACSGDAPEAEECADPVAADTVQLEDFAFEPNCLVAQAGGQIHLENVGDAPHTFTVEGTSIDLDLPAGTTTEASLTGVDAGSYGVICTYHTQMSATLTVEGQ